MACMVSSARAALIAGVLGLVPAIAMAQATPAPTDAPAAATGTPAAAAGPAGDSTAAPAGSATPAPVIPATGYGWSTTPKKHPGHGQARVAHTPKAADNTPDVVLPGFETLADGTSRLFVQLSKPVAYDTKAAAGTITYVLKGVHVDRRNNYNPLVTVHFNTPVTSARLVPHGKDLWFVVDLRASVQPTVAMDAAKDGAAMLRIEFAKGDYLPASDSADVTPGAAPVFGPGAKTTATAPAAAAPTGAAPTPRVMGGGRHHGRPTTTTTPTPAANPSTL